MRVCASLPRAEKTNVIEADGPELAAPILGAETITKKLWG